MTDELTIRFVGDMQRLQVKPGDRYILTMDQPITPTMHEAISAAWKAFIGPDAKLFVMHKGMKLGVIGEQDPHQNAVAS